MNSVVVNINYWGFLVAYPYNSSLNFFANTPEALIEGLKKIKFSYNPNVYQIVSISNAKFKLKKLTKKEIETFQKNVKALEQFK